MTNKLHPIGDLTPAVSAILSTVLQGAAEGILIEDQENRIVALNTAVLQIFDYEDVSPEIFLGKSVDYFENYGTRKISHRDILGVQETDAIFGRASISQLLIFSDGFEVAKHSLPIVENQALTGHIWLYGESTVNNVHPQSRINPSITPLAALVEDRKTFKVWTRAKLVQSLFDGLSTKVNHVLLIKVRDISKLIEAIGILKVSTFISYFYNEIQAHFSPHSVFRVKHDEILFLTNENDLNNVFSELEEVRAKICKMPEIFFQIEIAIGSTHISLDSKVSIEESLNEVAIALHASIRERKQISFSKEISQLEYRRDQILAALPWAVSEKKFQMAIQPIVDLQTHNLVGYEALSRWNHQTLGMISAQEFIPLASELNYLTLIDRANFEILLRNSADILKDRKIRISLNISAAYLEPKRNLVGTLEKFIGDFQASPGQFVLELTESELMTNFSDAISTLKVVHGLGIGIAIDDFGVGNSSLSVLQKIPFDYIKMDKSFVESLNDERTRVVVKTVAQIGETFGAMTIAEGVETQEQANILKSLDINAGQGWFFGRPEMVQN